ncbi:DciA family protein [Noviherbaspirillum sp. UKPF54]|uniref:DciA family protein n=1 Tax=Noviherbaspirillum sp. UKPF54 TaxID=2601898 RepID=UPI0011B19314|nr:DciA family protein [Noviherbaspirillum sp. UKPF54]QDZ28934.1 DUF721 domain-containing protein [Noviherbaspirillum sp. UKPF54]
MRPPSFLLSQSGAKTMRKSASTQGITDFLRANEKLASLLPAARRIMMLQRECVQVLPAMFEVCTVMQFDAGQLILATPNAAVATKLKQQLPKLQDNLLKRGWQVNAIRIKVQPGKIAEKQQPPAKQLVLPRQAVSALAELKHSLESDKGNEALTAALGRMLNRHRDEC